MFDIDKPLTDAEIQQMATQYNEIAQHQEMRIDTLVEDLIDRGPFYAYRYKRLTQVMATWLPTCATDGKHMFWNPFFISSLSDEEMLGVMVHELLHVVGLHNFRMGHRDQQKWNIACDYAINELVKDEGWSLPSAALLAHQFFQKFPEEIYDLLPDSPGGGGGEGEPSEGGGDGELSKTQQDNMRRLAEAMGQTDPRMKEAMASPMQTGTILKPRNEDGEVMSGREIEAAKQEAQIDNAEAEEKAKSAGDMPAGAQRTIRELYDNRVNWKQVLDEWVRDIFGRNDYTWAQPNRRTIWRRMYMPGWEGTKTGKIAIAVDTSGSISVEMLEQFMTELQFIIDEVNAEDIHVIYCDAQVKGEDHFGELSGVKDVLSHARIYGGGGTAFQPVFDHIDQQLEDPAILIYFTDMYGPMPHSEPEYPVIWAAYGTSVTTAPFGTFLPLDGDSEYHG